MSDTDTPKNAQELPSGPADETVDIATPASAPYTPVPPRKLREMTMSEMGVPMLLFGLALAGAIFVGVSMAHDAIASAEADTAAMVAENVNLTTENVALTGNLSAEQAFGQALAVRLDNETEKSSNLSATNANLTAELTNESARTAALASDNAWLTGDRDYYREKFWQLEGKLNQHAPVPGVPGTARYFGNEYVAPGNYGTLYKNEGVDGYTVYAQTEGARTLVCYKHNEGQRGCSAYQDVTSVYDPMQGGWTWPSLYNGEYEAYSYFQIIVIGEGNYLEFAVSYNGRA